MHGNLQPFYKKQPVTINKNYNQRTINLFYQVNSIEILASDAFTNNIKKLIKPGNNIPDEIKIQTKTIEEQYNALNESIAKRTKYLNPNIIKEPQKCEIIIQLFKESTAKYLLNEIEILVKDLPAPNSNIQVDTNTRQRTSGILMQAILDMNEIIFLLNSEIVELENILNHQVTEHIMMAIQDSPCIKSTLMEKLTITNVISTKTGLTISISINQFEHTKNAFEITPTSYFGKHINFENTFIIHDQLSTCHCLHQDNKIYTGCKCTPFNPKCSNAILSNTIKKLIKDCPFIETKTQLPTLTHTGVLFPAYSPFTIENSDLLNSIPTNPELPFHVQSNNPIHINTKDSIITLQSATNLPEKIQTLTLTQEELNLLTDFMIPIPITNILTYISWGIGSFSLIILLPITCGIICYYKKRNIQNIDNTQRKTVSLKLTPLLF